MFHVKHYVKSREKAQNMFHVKQFYPKILINKGVKHEN